MNSDDNLPPRILCVDDHKELCDELEAVLAKLPARVEVAYDGNTAMDRLIGEANQSDPYRLVVFDMFVPYLTRAEVDPELGLKLLRDFQRGFQVLPLGTPIIIFTQYPSYDNCVACVKAGAVDYIDKGGDLQAGRTGIEILYERCRKLLYPEKAPADAIVHWLETHLEELIAEHGGEFVGVVPEHLAREAALEDQLLGGFVLITGQKYEEVRDKMLHNNVLRRHKPRILRIPRAKEPKNDELS